VENAINQAYIFFVFILNGILIGILFDLFRILRKSFKTPDIITYVQDVVFWLLTGLLTLFFLFQFQYGALRLYVLIGILAGVSIYLLTISKYFILLNVTIIKFIKDIIRKIISILIYPIKVLLRLLRKIFIKPISFLFINVRGIFKKRT